MSIEKLFWSIFNAQNEDKLHEIVLSDNLLSNNDNWYPYGGLDEDDKGNFRFFDNQQSNPIPALSEKITNSIRSGDKLRARSAEVELVVIK